MKRDSSEPRPLATLAATAVADPDVWELRLYVAGKTAKSVAAADNLTRLCEAPRWSANFPSQSGRSSAICPTSSAPSSGCSFDPPGRQHNPQNERRPIG
jgi:hypothetical protein